MGIVVIPRGEMRKPETRPRVLALLDQMRGASLRQLIIACPEGRITFDPGADVMTIDVIRLPEAIAGPALFVWSDQYHAAAEWMTKVLDTAVRDDVVATHDGFQNLMALTLSICAAMVAAPAKAAVRLAQAVADGTDLRNVAVALNALAVPYTLLPVDHGNVAPLYARAVTLDIPVTFIVETNSSCNYACYMCPYHGERQRDKPTYIPSHKHADMDLNLFKRVVDEIAALERLYNPSTKAMVVPYRRGELLLYPHWREALAHIKSKENLIGYFSSNGSLWTDEDIDYILDIGLDHLQISVEGHDAETHKRIRMNDEFEKVAGTIRRLIAARQKRGMTKPILQLAHTVNERSHDVVDQYVDYWLNKVDTLLLGPENYADDEYRNKHYKTEFSPVPAPAAELRPPCSMIKDCMWISADGTAILCIGSKQTIIGDVNKQSVKELLESPVRAAVIRNHIEGNYSKGICNSCEQWYSSYGKNIETDAYTAFISADTQFYRRKGELQLDW